MAMSERHRDPLELWVGTWTPEEWIRRENRKREQSAAEMKTPEPQPQMGEAEKADRVDSP
jgi:hypothetical protein